MKNYYYLLSAYFKKWIYNNRMGSDFSFGSDSGRIIFCANVP